jgi:hypothetical protein
MADDRVKAITALLGDTEAAHGAYEKTELNGVYDREWARWYADYAIDHGISELLGRDISGDELATFLSTSYADFEGAQPALAEPWSGYTARRIAAELA